MSFLSQWPPPLLAAQHSLKLKARSTVEGSGNHSESRAVYWDGTFGAPIETLYFRILLLIPVRTHFG